jgi:hypothetical protein
MSGKVIITLKEYSKLIGEPLGEGSIELPFEEYHELYIKSSDEANELKITGIGDNLLQMLMHSSNSASGISGEMIESRMAELESINGLSKLKEITEKAITKEQDNAYNTYNPMDSSHAVKMNALNKMLDLIKRR